MRLATELIANSSVAMAPMFKDIRFGSIHFAANFEK